MRWSWVVVGWMSTALFGCLSDGRPLAEYEEWLKNAGELNAADAVAGTDTVSTVDAFEPVDGNAGPTCPQITAGTTCSATGGGAVAVTFTNTCSKSLDIYWVDFACAEKKYLTIDSGTSKGMNTYFGHVWRARDTESGALVAEVQLEVGKSTAVSVP